MDEQQIFDVAPPNFSKVFFSRVHLFQQILLALAINLNQLALPNPRLESCHANNRQIELIIATQIPKRICKKI
jgi:hypothetical protein